MIIILVLIILFGIYAFFENRAMLCIRRKKIGSGNIRIAHLGDLHTRSFGKNNSRLCAKIADEAPDLILISGDLVSRKCRDFSVAEATVRSLAEIAPVYMVIGNHEADLPTERFSHMAEKLGDLGVRLLRNETVTLEIKGRKLNISGLELEYSVYKVNGGYRDLTVPTADEIRSKLGVKPSGETLLLVHNPLFADVYSDWGADYAVCGHVHGGSVMLPFTNIGLLSPERKLIPKYSKGVYTVGNTKLLLTGGLGKPRLFNPPEFSVYEI